MIPNRLKKGDKIGIISPSNYIAESKLEDINQSILLMEASGYEITFAKNVFSNTLGYSNTAKEKAQDIHQMFQDTSVKAILCGIGGENASNCFEYLDFDLIKRNPKIICGFSDNISLLNMIYEKTGLVTFHGPTFRSLTSWETQYAYQQIIETFEKQRRQIGEVEDEYMVIREGQAEGELVGGNVSVFSKLVAGKFCMNLENKILFLEELGAETSPRMLSNYLYYMKQNEVFHQIKGIWIGNYEHPSGVTIERVLQDVLEGEYSFPIIKSNNFGHTEKKAIIPIGARAQINTKEKVKIQLLEDIVK